MEMSEGSRDTTATPTFVRLPKVSAAVVESRNESTPVGNRAGRGPKVTLCGVPATPVVRNLAAGVTPATLAVTSFKPAIVPRVNRAAARPSAPVATERGVTEPFPAETLNNTGTPAIGSSAESRTITAIGTGIV